MDDQAESAPVNGSNKKSNNSENTSESHVFEYHMPRYLRYLLWWCGGLLFLSVCLYVLTLLRGGTHHFDKERATDFVRTTARVLNSQKNRLVTDSNLYTVRIAMARALSPKNYFSVNLEYFIRTGANDSLFTIKHNPIEIKQLITKINSLPDTQFRRFDHSTAFFEKKLDPWFAKYNLSQFISESNFWNKIEDVALYSTVFFIALFLGVCSLTYYSIMKQRRHFERNIRYAAAMQTSTNMTESWVTAQAMLDVYHQRNLDQNNWTFRLSVLVMGIGCALIFYGINTAIELNLAAKGVSTANNGSSLIGIISTASGVVINIIGGTFLAIYNSTLKQAIDYTNCLQRTSTVGTSLAILKSIEDEQNIDPRDPVTMAKLVDAKIAIAKQLTNVPS